MLNRFLFSETIRTKLGAAAFGALALIVSVGAFSAWQVKAVAESTSEVTEVWLPKVTLLSELQSALNQHYLLAKSRQETTNFRLLAQLIRQSESLEGSIAQRLRALSATVSIEAEADHLHNFGLSWQGYLAAITKIGEALEAGSLSAATAEFNGGLASAYASAIQQIREQLELTKDHSARAKERAQSRLALALSLTIGFAIFAGVGAWLVQAWVSADICRPLVQISSSMERLTAGDYSPAELPTTRRADEIGTLIEAFAGYRESLLRGQRLADLVAHDREQLNAAISNMPIGLAMFSSNGALIVSNDVWRQMYSIQAEATVTYDAIVEATGLVARLPSEIRTALAIRSLSAPHDTILQLDDGRSINLRTKPMAHGGWVCTHEDISDRIAAQQKIAYLAQHDGMTGLPNRSGFRQQADAALKRVKRGEKIAVHCLDLDRFKAVNDTLGHHAGDELLCAVGARLKEVTRDTDALSRFGGDEFVILQTMLDTEADARSLAARVISTLSAPYQISGQQVVIGCSVGISLAPEHGVDLDDLIKKADTALYRSKASGRGLFQIYQAAMDVELGERAWLDMHLRSALLKQQLELFYQPIMDLTTNEISSFEALLRWNHPERGLIPPNAFIPVAEETGLIVQIGEWVIRQACHDASNWACSIGVSVNLSAKQIAAPGLASLVANALANAGLSSARLELEVTESSLLNLSQGTMTTLKKLKELGVKLSLDDFGTGFSGLANLQSLPIDKIKIDRSFVTNIVENAKSQAIVHSVLSMASRLSVVTTAEGVETEAQLRELRSINCSQAQGYLFGKPQPLKIIEVMLGNRGLLDPAGPGVRSTLSSDNLHRAVHAMQPTAPTLLTSKAG